MKTKMMRSANKMTFQEIIIFAISVENSAKNLSRMRGPSDIKSKGGIIYHIEKKPFFETPKWQKNNGQRQNNVRTERNIAVKCGSCGRDAHDDKQSCPAKGKECFRCKILTIL